MPLATGGATPGGATGDALYFDDTLSNVVVVKKTATNDRPDLRVVQVPTSYGGVPKSSVNQNGRNKQLCNDYYEWLLARGEVAATVPLLKLREFDVNFNLFDSAFFDPQAGLTAELLAEANNLGRQDLLFLDYDFTISKTAGFLSSEDSTLAAHTAAVAKKLGDGEMSVENLYLMYIGGKRRMAMLRSFLRKFGLDRVHVITANPRTELIKKMMHVLVGEPFDNVYYEPAADRKRDRIVQLLEKNDRVYPSAAGWRRGQSYSAF